MSILSILYSTRLLRFLLATIIVMSIVFIYSSYPLKNSFEPELRIVYPTLNLNRTAAHPIFRQVNKFANIRKEKILVPMKEQNYTEFREFSLHHDENENITITAQSINGFTNYPYDLDDINSISTEVNLTDKNLTHPVHSTVKYKSVRCEEIYVGGHLYNEIDVARICPMNGEKLELLMLVTSKWTHVGERMAIRQTWGHFASRKDVSLAFMLGQGLDKEVNQTLSDENNIYGDIIQGNFIDSYNNLTLKTISYLEWIDENCSRAKYILKTDDDVFINVPRLLKFLSDHTSKRVIYGRLSKQWKAVRNPKSKYYVSRKEYPQVLYPVFCTGPAYVLSGDIIHDLYVKALKTLCLKLEDVFITGIVANSLGINRIHATEFSNRRVPFSPVVIRRIISVHMLTIMEQFELWGILQENSVNQLIPIK